MRKIQLFWSISKIPMIRSSLSRKLTRMASPMGKALFISKADKAVNPNLGNSSGAPSQTNNERIT
jgi:hypothetical protein